MTQTPIDRPMIFIGMLILTSICTAVWSYGQLHEAHLAAVTAANDLVVCRRLETEISRLGNQPATAHSQQIHLNELTRHIEQSTQAAQIAPDSLIRIWPDPPIRIGDSPYQKKSTQVLFRRITLRELITFLHNVVSQNGGPQVSRIRLLAPRGDESGNHWTAETTLTYLIYAPRIKTAS